MLVFFSGWMCEREKKSWPIFIHFHFFALRSEFLSPNSKMNSFIDSQGWIYLHQRWLKYYSPKMWIFLVTIFSLLLSNFIFRFLNFSLNFHPMSSCVSYFSKKCNALTNWILLLLFAIILIFPDFFTFLRTISDFSVSSRFSAEFSYQILQ